MSEKRLGVLGGLGPMATAYFMELVTDMTDAKTDQEHLEMLVYSAPSIPDRTRYILDHSQESPLPQMLRVGTLLADQQVTAIAIPCVTAHYFFRELEEGIPAPLINGVRETVLYLKGRNVQKVGIMATSGTVQSGVFHRELERNGMEAVIPTEAGQADVMRLIFDNVKAGIPADMEKFKAVAAQLRGQGAQAIVLGCTELSVIKRDNPIGPGFIDVMEVLAQQAVLRCGKNIKESYKELITK